MPNIIATDQAHKRRRATVDEVLDFANKVRAAGGGNPIDALVPSVPEDESACLIARNLNFNCTVTSGHHGEWGMHVDDREVAQRIADSLGLKVFHFPRESSVIDLPPRIGQVASDFDNVSQVLHEVLDRVENDFWERFGGHPTDACITDALYADDHDYTEGLNDKQRKFIDRRVRYWLRRVPKRLREDVRELMPLVQSASAEARRLATFVNPDGSIVR